ncbi:MAG: YraN family protein [Alistipes sp.]|nr:YraN family protein [Alistipes sp.]
MTTAETGRAGECAAAEHLRREGYEMLARNWREGRYELDLVALRDDVLHFVEVKTRRFDGLTPPEAAMTADKCRALRRAASAYLARSGWQGEVQFDLAAVDIRPDGTTDVRFIEEAVEYNWR